MGRCVSLLNVYYLQLMEYDSKLKRHLKIHKRSSFIWDIYPGSLLAFLTGHNTLRRHIHLMGLSDSPLCRRCGTGNETSAHILCECEALASLRHVYLGSSFLEPEDIQRISLGAIWNFSRATGLP